jgi:hypothetical protein
MNPIKAPPMATGTRAITESAARSGLIANATPKA